MFQQVEISPVVHTTDGIRAIGRLHLPAVNRRKAKAEVQARQRAWLREVCDATGLKPTQLASGAHTSTTTLTRFLNDADYTGTLSPETIERIKSTYKVPGPEEYANTRRAPLIGLSEAVRLDPRREGDDVGPIIAAILRNRPHVEAWRLKTVALETAGYIPGDIVFVETLDEGQMPKPQDAVCAQVHDFQHASMETVWRVYDPPFLVAASQDRTGYKPILIDGDRVRIYGVVRESFRPHSLSATR